MFYEERCIHCGQCLQACETGHRRSGDRISLEREKHSEQFFCAQVCPGDALRVCGRSVAVDDLLSELAKDVHYYGSDGGVTFSGGECLLYSEYVAVAASRCKNLGVHTCVDTSLAIPWENVEAVAGDIRLFLVDLKHSDDKAHNKLTGVGNKRIINNLTRLSKLETEIWVRIALIPGYNDSPGQLLNTAGIVNAIGGSIRRVELLKYNNLAINKYTSLGREMAVPRLHPQDDREMRRLGALLRDALTNEIELVY